MDGMTTSRMTPLHPTSALAAEFWEKGRSDSCPVIDMHGHMGPFYGIYFPRAEAEQMIRSMDAAGVRLLCFAHHAALNAPDVGNATALAAAQEFPGRLRVYLSVNPQYPELAARELAGFDAHRHAYVGLKFLSAYHRVCLDDARYQPALEFAQERRLPVLLHTWGGCAYAGMDQILKAAHRYPGIQFLLGHSLHGKWDDAVRVAQEAPNTWLELTAEVGLRGVVELLVERAGSDRMLYGTDLPWFDEHHYIGNLLAADITDEDRHRILHRNAEKILGLPPAP